MLHFIHELVLIGGAVLAFATAGALGVMVTVMLNK